MAEETKPSSTTTPKVDPSLDQKVDKLTELVTKLSGVIVDEREKRKELTEFVQNVADKSRLQRHEQKLIESKAKKREFTIPTYYGKIVVGWTAMLQNVIYQAENKTWIERQTTRLIFEDNSEKEVIYKDWQNARVMIKAFYEGEELLSDGTRIIKVKTEKGTQLSIDVKFLN